MLEFSYLCFLLFLFIFSFYLLKQNNMLAPQKIKLFINILLIPLILRIGVLILLTFIEKQELVYYFKYLNYIYLFSIPLSIIVALYIFLRDEKLKFNYCYIFVFALLGLYLAVVKLFNFNVEINSTYGYIISLEKGIIINLVYLTLLSTSLIGALLNVDKKYNNKFGMIFLLAVIIIYIIEYLLFLGGIKLYPYPIFGEGLILTSLLIALNTFKG